MSRRPGRGTGAILRELRVQGDRIVAAIREASAEQRAHREAQVDRARTFLRDALDEGTPRTVVLDHPGERPSALADHPGERPSALADHPGERPSALADHPGERPSALADHPGERPSALADPPPRAPANDTGEPPESGPRS